MPPKRIPDRVLAEEIGRRLITRRQLLRGAAVGGVGLMAVPLLAACTGEGEQDEDGIPTAQATAFIMGLWSEASPLDPHTSVGEITETINTVMFDRLIERDLRRPYDDRPSPPIVPVLAESFEGSEDARSYTVRIREGVQFHDGTPFDLAALRFNMERMGVEDSPNYYEQAGAVTAFLWQHLDGLEEIDERTLVLHFAEAFSELPSMMCESTGNPAMISPTQVEITGNEEFGENPVGTGPYVFGSRARGQEIRFASNPNPWPGGREPVSSELIFRPIVDVSARVNALRGGSVHAINFPPPDALPELEQLGFVVHTSLTPSTYYLSFNLNQEPFRDVRVRQAINHAIDREALANDLWGGMHEPWGQVVAPTSGTAADDAPEYGYDPDRARQLLAEAGYPDGFRTVFEASPEAFEPFPTAVVEQLGRVGIRAELETFEWLTYFGRWAEGMRGGVGINIMSWGMNSPWWLNHVFVNFNTGHIEDEEILGLLADADREMDENRRLDIYRTVSRMDVERAYHAPLTVDKLPVVTASNVQGLVHAQNWWFDYSGVWVEE